ncbi:hypothetical protein [Psychroserpens ponticola]|uniref:Uncharacterized protein n=1 Tax=Psychroserpens ponticola TaxID=2932268 RepID=A0ABY7RZ55_9FLAO|nr:hypothetical protein [Psychroserpens ponticola]WCO02429.1 hypothetical protein MUN68_002795 [Psychroserpens ponticola]
MNIKFLLPLAFIFSVLTVNTSFSQSSQKQKPLQHVVYNSNVDAPLTSIELKQIKEVYGEHAEEDILSKPQRLKDVKHILRNRVEVIEHLGKDLSSFTNLSTVPLFNHYNKTLNRDALYNASTFNPLKYQFNFYSREGSKTYRFDNSPYLIIIKSQNPQ